MIRKLATTLALAGALAAPALTVSPAHASTASKRWQAWTYAKNQRGCWYNWGGTGPCGSGFDCSGLVYRAYRREGFAIPRTTTSMLGWWRLKRVSHANAKMGDLAFYSSGHVELYAGSHTTFGAQQSGTRVNYHRWYSSSWYQPSGYYHVIGAG